MKIKIALIAFCIVLIFSTSILAESGTQAVSGFQKNGLYRTGFYFFEAVLILSLLAIWIFNLVTYGKRSNAKLKANIEKLRNEEFYPSHLKELKKFRSSLIKKITNHPGERRINKARKYEISTGEIDLALKLKSLLKN
ncbi:MAG: hypothetical protein NTX22_11025 [Ignavibacteriales bacterium]|nr:hypothetical protein [Ignavibacteriales bacterium]